MSEEEKEYDIEKTLNQVGILYPVIADAKGRIIDGYHRLAVDPEWPVYKLLNIKTDEQYALAKLIANLHRRKMKEEEKSEKLAEIAELTGWSPNTIAEKVGMSYSWVVKYLPNKYKVEEKAKAGRVGGVKSGASRREAETVVEGIQPREAFEASASLTEETETVVVEPQVAEESKKSGTFKCRACLEVYHAPLKPVNVKLCPECEMQFQMWLADRR